MSAPRLIIDRDMLLPALEEADWNKSQTATALGVHRQTIARLVRDYALEQPPPVPAEVQEDEEPEEESTYTALDGSIEPTLDLAEMPLPSRGGISRYILTSAQNNTGVHTEMWQSLTTLADHYDAKLLVSRYTYNKSAYKGAHQAKLGTRQRGDEEQMWYDPAISEYVCDHRVQLAPDLEFCGEMNILPTAIRPLSGLDTYTKSNSAIIPHAKMAMTTVPGMKFDGPNFSYTTGTCTLRNYIQRKQGQKAQFHHVYGALLVEVDPDGDWWVRQLMSTEDGTIQDLDVISTPEGVSTDNYVEGIVFGDIHNKFLTQENYNLCWGPGGMCDRLAPKVQVIHDVLDFRARTHHEMKSPHQRFKKWADGIENVEYEVNDVAKFLASIDSAGCETVVVDSNHDAMLTRWLASADYRDDPVNARFFLKCQLKMYVAMESSTKLHLLEDLCRDAGYSYANVTFLNTDESYQVKGIECSLHGHRGPDGARGSVANLNRLGVLVCPAHTHRATIHDGVWSPGVMGALDQGYNIGPSSWSHSNVVIYQTGKRGMITYRNNKWRA